jgi:hypothetical protein
MVKKKKRRQRPVCDRYIYRKEKRKYKGWLVIILGNKKEIRITTFFRDDAYGGKAGSKKAAKAYRDLELRHIPECYKNKLGMDNNKNKIFAGRGVRYQEKAYDGRVYEIYIASWQAGGKTVHKTFNIKTYGKREAKRLAVEAREAAVKNRKVI